MSVESKYKPVSYTGTGGTSVFPFGWVCYDKTWIHVSADGLELTQGTDYTVALESTSGGSVTLSAPLAAGKVLIIWMDVPITQENRYPNTGQLNVATIEMALDKQTLISQQQQDAIGRCVMVEIGSDVNPSEVIEQVFLARDSATSAATQAKESEKACNDVMIRIPAPESKDIGKFLIVRMNDDLPVYALVPQSQMQGYFEYTIPVVSKDGVCTIVLAEIGHPEMQDVFNPIINIIAAKQYYHCIKDISKTGFLVQIYRKDGTPGVDIAEYIESSTFTAGENQQCGTPGSGATVKLGISIPNPGAQ